MSFERTWLRAISELGVKQLRKDLLGLEGEGCYGRAGEAGEAGICHICDVDEYGGWRHDEIKAIGEVQVRSDLGADDEIRVERWADSGDTGDSEWGERDLGQGDLKRLHLLGGCDRAIEFDVSGEAIEAEFEEATFEEVDNFLSIVDEAGAAGGLLGNDKFALPQMYCAFCCTVLATKGNSMWPNARLEMTSSKFRRVHL